MSLGLLLSQEWGFRPVEELLHEADVALYAAKAAGRNCVKLASPTALSTAPEPQEQEHIRMPADHRSCLTPGNVLLRLLLSSFCPGL